MALSGLDIYKLLPKTNCRQCGYSTCLAFAMALAKKQVALEKCPFIKPEVKDALEQASLPPMRTVTIGTGDDKVEVGNETVLFRHEEKFHNPTAIGFIIDDNISDSEFGNKVKIINNLSFERVGQLIKVNLIALRQTGKADNFVQKAKKISQLSNLGLVLMANDVQALKGALENCAKQKPLIYKATEENIKEFAALAKAYGVSLAISAGELEKIEELAQKANQEGLSDIVLDTGNKSITKKIEDLTFARRLALKKKRRSIGYPVITVVEDADPYQEAIEAGTYIAKYASIVLIKTVEAWQTLALLTLRQNIYTDPQKPLQVEPKVYNIGQVNEQSPVMVTTNFSLSYYTVLGEVEASKVPSYILSVDTEGMSVLTAWAAEKFTPEKITDSLAKSGLKEKIKHNKLIIPGYVSVMSGDLEDKSGWQIIVGPKEASGLPSFLKKM
ncbi:MAG: acetyl-CoA decarbonylase/synthase complex subunit gamma [Candidatus Omnitrophica bacterium]|nr:acetyl-CoA decarbonylase/synthase complex subunit gamma [Candidatus Omnitrophota bacterium]MDD5352573.1 acetyl-CoA decarbonylase/synthase complex subunit gamma [Candidatus Omnitrophota bacterium]MDD5550171.1 acetyl-CoA decarbonylase/synthase complex subunit gamma [Candidatus Omnitrophota bacterium]